MLATSLAVLGSSTGYPAARCDTEKGCQQTLPHNKVVAPALYVCEAVVELSVVNLELFCHLVAFQY